MRQTGANRINMRICQHIPAIELLTTGQSHDDAKPSLRSTSFSDAKMRIHQPLSARQGCAMGSCTQ